MLVKCHLVGTLIRWRCSEILIGKVPKWPIKGKDQGGATAASKFK